MVGRIVFLGANLPQKTDENKRQIASFARVLVRVGLLEARRKPWYHIPETYYLFKISEFQNLADFDDKIKLLHPQIIFIHGKTSFKQLKKCWNFEKLKNNVILARLREKWGIPVVVINGIPSYAGKDIKNALKEYNLLDLIGPNNVKPPEIVIQEEMEEEEAVRNKNMRNNLDKNIAIIPDGPLKKFKKNIGKAFAPHIGIINIPKNWTFIPTGNVARTRAIKREKRWWTVLEKVQWRKRRQKLSAWKPMGFLCPKDTLYNTMEYLERTKDRREKARARRQKKKEEEKLRKKQELLKKFGITIETAVKKFLNLDDESSDLVNEIIESINLHSKVKSLFPVLPNTVEEQIAFSALENAIVNHIRHICTDYEMENILKIYKFCYVCGGKLHTPVLPIKIETNWVCQLRMCCNCYDSLLTGKISKDYVIQKAIRKL